MALVGLAAALANNLPASVSVGSLLGAGPSAYAATIGLGVGALALPQGSVATLLAVDLAGPDAPRSRCAGWRRSRSPGSRPQRWRCAPGRCRGETAATLESYG